VKAPGVTFHPSSEVYVLSLMNCVTSSDAVPSSPASVDWAAQPALDRLAQECLGDPADLPVVEPEAIADLHVVERLGERGGHDGRHGLGAGADPGDRAAASFTGDVESVVLAEDDVLLDVACPQLGAAEVHLDAAGLPARRRRSPHVANQPRPDVRVVMGAVDSRKVHSSLEDGAESRRIASILGAEGDHDSHRTAVAVCAKQVLGARLEQLPTGVERGRARAHFE